MKVIIKKNEYTIITSSIREDVLIDECASTPDNKPLPYWKLPWHASKELISVIENLDGTHKNCIELGCGLGIGSLAATLSNFTVTATDYYEEATQYAKHNVFTNTGITINTQVLDFTSIPQNNDMYDLVIMSDVGYNEDYQQILPHTINALLKHDGVCYISEQHRIPIVTFLRECKKLSLNITLEKRTDIPTLISVYKITK